MNPWEQIKQHLATKISTEGYQNWLAKTEYSQADASTIWVQVPNEAAKEWIEEEYGAWVHSALKELKLPYRNVAYDVAHSLENKKSLDLNPQSGANDFHFGSAVNLLNPKFTFNSFVVGSCNQFAHAAAQAVGDMPANRYNPLFIYGGVGMGKTHLMHAIGRSLLDKHRDMRIIYTSSERFTNEMISCIKQGRMAQFHQHYRTADALLVDDVQFLAGKERTQEEFFYTFNDLYDNQKQIVISSDSPPKNTPGLVERLRSRFEWGLMVDVQPPDLETKMAILDKKADQEGIALPEEVRIFIATKTKSNVRELEGALVKLLAYSSVTGEPVTLSMAQQILKHLVTGQDKRINIEAIIRAVAERYSLQPAQIKQKSNTRQIAYPRQIAMYLAKELTPASLPEIGRAFGGKHHTTVMHSVQKIEGLRQKDPDLNKTIHNLIDSLH
jgi:chromosomal replication initiator protein